MTSLSWRAPGHAADGAVDPSADQLSRVRSGRLVVEGTVAPAATRRRSSRSVVLSRSERRVNL